MLVEFRQYYPNGSLISELVQNDHGQYIVRSSVAVDGITLATGLSISSNLEEAEDRSIQRALALLDLKNRTKTTNTPDLLINQPPLVTLNKPVPTIIENNIEIPVASNTYKGDDNKPEVVTEVLQIKPPKVIDNAEMIALINFELVRIGWKTEQGREYLLSTYGKKSRHMLTDNELADFFEFSARSTRALAII